MKQSVLAEAGYENVGVPVIVVVCHRYSHAPTLVDQPTFEREVRKGSVAVIAEQAAGGTWQSRVVEQLEGRPVDHQHIKQAVIVVVEDRHTAAYRFHQVVFGRRAAGITKRGQAGLFGNVDEPGAGCEHRLAAASAAEQRYNPAGCPHAPSQEVTT